MCASLNEFSLMEYTQHPGLLGSVLFLFFSYFLKDFVYFIF